MPFYNFSMKPNRESSFVKSSLPDPGKVGLGRLFWEMFSLSAFTFGGGYVIVALMQNRFVNKFHWIDEQEMLDLVAIAQSAPGVMAVNAAIVVGYKLCGMPGVVLSVLATIIPPFVSIYIIGLFYQALSGNPVFQWVLDGMSAAVAAIIFASVYDMAAKVISDNKIVNLTIMAASFIFSQFLGINIIWIILCAIACGLAKTVYEWKKPDPDSKAKGAGL